MIASIHQPNFFPWMGFFDKINRSDHFVLLTASYRSKSDKFLTRTKIVNNLKQQYLSVPLGNQEIPINRLMMPENNQWKLKSLNVIHAAYHNTNFHDEVFSDVEKLLMFECKYYSEYSINIITYFVNKFNINTILHIDSDFDKNFGTSNQRNIALCKEIGGDVYLSGNGAKDYNDDNLYKKSSISLVYQDYIHPFYKQQSSEFVSGLSILDTVFNCGYNEAEILLKNS